MSPEAQEIVDDLVDQGWAYDHEEPMGEEEARWWAKRPELGQGRP